MSVVVRYPDWPRRLDAAIEAARGRPFCWGTHDCMTFSASVVQALTGWDPAPRWRGGYDGVRSALRLMARNGGMAVMVTRTLGDPVSPASAQRGDVVLRCDELGPALGVCLGAKCAFVSPEGLVQRPLGECVQAWRV